MASNTTQTRQNIIKMTRAGEKRKAPAELENDTRWYSGGECKRSRLNDSRQVRVTLRADEYEQRSEKVLDVVENCRMIASCGLKALLSEYTSFYTKTTELQTRLERRLRLQLAAEHAEKMNAHLQLRAARQAARAAEQKAIAESRRVNQFVLSQADEISRLKKLLAAQREQIEQMREAKRAADMVPMALDDDAEDLHAAQLPQQMQMDNVLFSSSANSEVNYGANSTIVQTSGAADDESIALPLDEEMSDIESPPQQTSPSEKGFHLTPATGGAQHPPTPPTTPFTQYSSTALAGNTPVLPVLVFGPNTTPSAGTLPSSDQSNGPQMGIVTAAPSKTATQATRALAAPKAPSMLSFTSSTLGQGNGKQRSPLHQTQSASEDTSMSAQQSNNTIKTVDKLPTAPLQSASFGSLAIPQTPFSGKGTLPKISQSTFGTTTAGPPRPLGPVFPGQDQKANQPQVSQATAGSVTAGRLYPPSSFLPKTHITAIPSALPSANDASSRVAEVTSETTAAGDLQTTPPVFPGQHKKQASDVVVASPDNTNSAQSVGIGTGYQEYATRNHSEFQTDSIPRKLTPTPSDMHGHKQPLAPPRGHGTQDAVKKDTAKNMPGDTKRDAELNRDMAKRYNISNDHAYEKPKEQKPSLQSSTHTTARSQNVVYKPISAAEVQANQTPSPFLSTLKTPPPPTPIHQSGSGAETPVYQKPSPYKPILPRLRLKNPDAVSKPEVQQSQPRSVPTHNVPPLQTLRHPSPPPVEAQRNHDTVMMDQKPSPHVSMHNVSPPQKVQPASFSPAERELAQGSTKMMFKPRQNQETHPASVPSEQAQKPQDSTEMDVEPRPSISMGKTPESRETDAFSTFAASKTHEKLHESGKMDPESLLLASTHKPAPTQHIVSPDEQTTWKQLPQEQNLQAMIVAAKASQEAKREATAASDPYNPPPGAAPISLSEARSKLLGNMPKSSLSPEELLLAAERMDKEKEAAALTNVAGSNAPPVTARPKTVKKPASIFAPAKRK
jgi:hypothetical protein